MSLITLFRRRPTRAHVYRIIRRNGGYEPQISYSAGTVKGFFWFPLDRSGYWLEPEAFSSGLVTKHISMPKEEAKRAILRAQAINERHIEVAS